MDINTPIICLLTAKVPVLTYGENTPFAWVTAGSFGGCQTLCQQSVSCQQFGFFLPPRQLCVLSPTYFSGITGNPDFMQWGLK